MRNNTKVLMELQEAEDGTALVNTAPMQEVVTCMKLQAGMHLIMICTGNKV